MRLFFTLLSCIIACFCFEPTPPVQVHTVGSTDEEIMHRFLGPGDKNTIKYETSLLQDILGNYSSGMRPVQSSKMPAIIQFDLRLNKLVKLDTKEQVLVVDAFVIMRWLDPQLQWNATNYNGTDIVNIPSTNVWTPDIVLYNTADSFKRAYTDIYTAPVIVRSNGSVLWTNSVTLSASCDINIKWFPVDSQKCPMTFGSWSYTAPRLKIIFGYQPTSTHEVTEDSFYISNGVWDFLDFSSEYSTKKYACCEEPFSQVEYKFELKRRPTFFLLYLIFPCIAIVVLALLSYLIPPEAGERIGFGVTVILSFSVYLIVISDKLPEKSDTSPLLGILYVLIFYMLVFSFVASTINVRLYYNKYRPPNWLVNLAQGSKRTWTISFKKKQKIGDMTKKIEVRSAGDHDREMKMKRIADADFENSEGGDAFRENLENNEDLYQSQWREISAYLDNMFLKIMIIIVVVCPFIVIKAL